MFKPEDFQIPLEAQLKLRVMTDEVKECKDVEALQESVIKTTELLVKYQHLLTSTLRGVIEKETKELLEEIETS